MAHIHLNPVQRIRLFNFIAAMPGSGSGFKLMDRLDRALRITALDAEARKGIKMARRALRDATAMVETTRPGPDRDEAEDRRDEAQAAVNEIPLFKHDAPAERFKLLDETDAETLVTLTRDLVSGEKKDAALTNADYRVFMPILDAIDAAKASMKDERTCAVCKSPRSGKGIEAVP